MRDLRDAMDLPPAEDTVAIRHGLVGYCRDGALDVRVQLLELGADLLTSSREHGPRRAELQWMTDHLRQRLWTGRPRASLPSMSAVACDVPVELGYARATCWRIRIPVATDCAARTGFPFTAEADGPCRRA
jgi:hypothetical protein